MIEEKAPLGPFGRVYHGPVIVEEVDPGGSGRTYDLADGGSPFATIIATSSSKTIASVPANSIWYSADVTGKDYDLTTTSNPSTSSGGITYKAVPWSSVSAIPSHGGGWVVKRNGVEIGYAYITGTDMNYVQTGSTASDFTNGDSFQWSSSLSIPSQSSYWLASCPERV